MSAPASPSAGLLSELGEFDRRLEELRTSGIAEHQRVFGCSERARVELREREQSLLRAVEAAHDELRQQLATLTHDNQDRLQLGLAAIQRLQERARRLSRELQGPGGPGAELRREVASFLSGERDLHIWLREPRFVARPQLAPSPGEIVSEERSLRVSGPQGAGPWGPSENGNPGSLPEDADTQPGHRSPPGRRDRDRDGPAGTGHLSGPGARGGSARGGERDRGYRNEGVSGDRSEGGSISGCAPAAIPGGGNGISPWAGRDGGGERAGSREAEEPVGPALGELGERESAGPVLNPAPSDRWSRAPAAAGFPPSPSTGAVGHPGVGSVGGEGGREGASDTPAQHKTSVHITDLQQPVLRARSRQQPGAGGISPAQRPSSGGSVYRATAVLISGDDSIGEERGPCGDGPGPGSGPGRVKVTLTDAHRDSAATVGGAALTPGWNGEPARGRWAATSRRRLRRREFSKSCVDLTAPGSSPVPGAGSAERPGSDNRDSLSEKSSSVADSLDSTNTFLIESARGSEIDPQSVGRRYRESRRSESNRGPRADANTGSPSQPGLHPCPAPVVDGPGHRSAASGTRSGERTWWARLSTSGSVAARPSGHSGHPSAHPPGPSGRPAARSPRHPTAHSPGHSTARSAGPSGRPAARSPGHSTGLQSARARSRSEANLSAAAPGQLEAQFGRYGSGPGELDLPSGLHAGPGGLLYVVDSGNRRLQTVEAPGGESGRSELQPVPLEPPDREPGTYFDVAVNGQGVVALTNVSAHSVDLYTGRGRLLCVITGTFQKPRGITVNARDQFLVTDTKRGEVCTLTVEARTGRAPDTRAHGGFQQPYFISAGGGGGGGGGGAGLVAVSERAFVGGCCVKLLDSELRLLSVLGAPGPGPGPGPPLANPWGVCVDQRGNVLVADWSRRHSLLLFPRHGPARVLVDAGLSSPRGLALLPHGQVAVADSMHNCVKVFRYL